MSNSASSMTISSAERSSMLPAVEVMSDLISKSWPAAVVLSSTLPLTDTGPVRVKPPKVETNTSAPFAPLVVNTSMALLPVPWLPVTKRLSRSVMNTPPLPWLATAMLATSVSRCKLALPMPAAAVSTTLPVLTIRFSLRAWPWALFKLPVSPSKMAPS